MALSHTTVLKFILRPVVRFCLKRALRLQDLYVTLKIVFVEVAEEELRIRKIRPNSSRISVMTGVYREDIPEILKNIASPEIETQNILAKVLGQWEQDERYCTRNGSPRVLDDGGEKSDFFKLVRNVSGGTYPPTIAKELLRIGSVKRTKKGLTMVIRGASLQESAEKSYGLLSRDIDALIQSAEHNIENFQPPGEHYVRTEYDNVVADAIPKIRKWMLDRGRKFHREIRDYVSQFDRDIHKDLASSQSSAAYRVIAHSFSVCIPPVIAPDAAESRQEKGTGPDRG